MAAYYKQGDTAFIVDNGRFCREVIIKRITRDLCIIEYIDTGTLIRVRKSRLFQTKREAELTLPPSLRPGINHWEYEMTHR